MTERGIPEDWSAARGSKPDQTSRLSRTPQFGETPASQLPVVGSTSKRVRRRRRGEQIPTQPPTDRAGSPRSVPPRVRLPFIRRGWLKSWAFWAVLGAVGCGGIGFTAMAMLLKLPAAPNCPSIFWPLASAAVRVHCAQLAASKQTVNDLLQAIALVEALPPDHPLRYQLDALLEQWSSDILQIADNDFQSGKLEAAIATAQKIPKNVSAYKLVEKQISDWRSIWSKAEGIFQEAEGELREQRWHQAFMAAARLQTVGNEYWATVKYQQLNRRIETAKEDGNKLAKAENLAKSGVVANILEAIKLAQAIGPESYIYRKAQEAIPNFGRKILDVAQARLDRRDADEAIEIASKLPQIAALEQEKEDFINLAEAQRSAWAGSVADLETAIGLAQQIGSNRPQYSKAQELISRWQLEIEDVRHLERARDLARQGTVSDLTAAIAEAQLVPPNNPRSTEARQDITRWRVQVETIEDRPYIERAEQLALLGDVNSLQAAIAEASQVGRGRALYQEARRKIRDWTGQVERIQDQPYLDQARDLASSGNLPAAISVAKQIAPGRALSSQAQAAVNDWDGQIRARENWRRAKQIAIQGTPEALSEAIRLADQVPTTSPLRTDVNPAMDDWGQQILDMALSQGEYDVPGGIETARLIPRGNAAYKAAREQIKVWERFLNPPEPEPTPVPEETTPITESQE